MKYCLGTVQFGTRYGIQGNGQPQYDDVYNMLSYAVDHGISHFDTASVYGEAERILGRFISTNPEYADRILIISKLDPDSFKNKKSEWDKIAVKSAKESLSLLGVQRFDTYLFHNASCVYDKEAIDALCTVRNVGLTERIGVSVYSPDEAMEALMHSQIDVIQVPYNLFDRRLDKAGFFKEAKNRGITVYARSTLLQGLALMDSERLPEKVSFAKDYLVEFEKICKRFSVSKLEAAIGYVNQKEGIDYILFGVDSQEQLEEYLSFDNYRLSDEMIEQIDELFYDVPEKLVNPVLWR